MGANELVINWYRFADAKLLHGIEVVENDLPQLGRDAGNGGSWWYDSHPVELRVVQGYNNESAL